jgi:hypothetical protein
MVIRQNKSQVIRYSLIYSLTVTLAVALGTEISGIIHQNYLKIFTPEYALVFFICFVVSAFLLWITSPRNYQIKLDEKGIQIINEEISRSLNWDEVKNIYHPTLLKHWWSLELNQGDRIKLPINRFTKLQQIELKKQINEFFH